MRLEQAGVVWTYPNQCAPLENVRILFQWNELRDQDVRFEVSDAAHQVYLEKPVGSKKGEAEIVIKPGGEPGVHFIRALTTDRHGEPYHRCGSFRVEAATSIASDTGEMDNLLELLGEGLRQTLDVAEVEGQRVTYYKAADNSRENFAYPAFAAPALRYFIRDLKTMFEAIYGQQWPSGRLPDHVYTDGNPQWDGQRRIRSVMADLETGMTSTLCKGWEAHGDDEWLEEMLPKMEAGLDYVTTDPTMYDKAHSVIKRPHTLDEWDIHFPSDDQCFMDESARFVLMQGDTSSMYEACCLMEEACSALGREERARYWRERQDRYYRRGNHLFWDGTKYRHHIHLDPLDHGDFDEDDQLAMSNTWAITRGFADHGKAISIIDEYVRRWKKTGDAFPWWSLQPGYPDELGYFNTSGPWSKAQGEYANGGLFPWVGGELCRAAFQHGKEKLAYRLLTDYHRVIQRDNGAVFTWYDLEGNAAINAPHHQTNYDPWGYSPWTQALVEELAGIKSKGKLLQEVECCPRWPVTKTKAVTAIAQFPASETYFAYEYRRSRDRIRLHFTGTGRHVTFRVLLPSRWEGCSGVTIDHEPVGHELQNVEKSAYVVINANIDGVRELVIARGLATS